MPSATPVLPTSTGNVVTGEPLSPRAVHLVIWGFALCASALPLIVHGELTGSDTLVVPLVQSLALLVGAFVVRRSARLRPVEPAVRWLACLAFGWHVVLGAVTGGEAWASWQTTVPWVVRGTVVQAFIFVPTILLLLAGPGRGTRDRLRLRLGDDRHRALADATTLGRRPSWRRHGAFWAVGVTGGTLTAMVFAVGGEVSEPGRLLAAAPVIALLAATNTFNEELHFRNVPLATLPALIGRRQALLLTAVVFGLEHYYGNPPAASGVLLAAFLGYLLAKSMLDTGGSRWAWAIHWLQDLVIFTFLALSWPT